MPLSDDRRPKCLSPTYLLRIWFYCLPFFSCRLLLLLLASMAAAGKSSSGVLTDKAPIQRATRERATPSVDALEARHWPFSLGIGTGAVVP